MNTIAANDPNTEIGIWDSASDIGNNLKKGDLFETILSYDFGGPSTQKFWGTMKFEGRVANLYCYSSAKLVPSTEAYKSKNASNDQLVPYFDISRRMYLSNAIIAPIGTHTDGTSWF